MSQRKLASLVGLSRDQLNNVELGRVALRFEPGWALCAELNLNPLWLWSGEGERFGFLDISTDTVSTDMLFSDLMSEIAFGYSEYRADRLTLEKRPILLEKEPALAKWIREVDPGDLGLFWRAIDRTARAFVFESRMKVNRSLTSRAHDETLHRNMRKQKLWPTLRERIRALTRTRGTKTQLARDIGVSRQAIDAMLSTSRQQPYVPSAEYALRLREWAKKETEVQQQIKSWRFVCHTRGG